MKTIAQSTPLSHITEIREISHISILRPLYFALSLDVELPTYISRFMLAIQGLLRLVQETVKILTDRPDSKPLK